ncbi:MAG: hypothetical protein RTU92_08535 [Candidatus Thorarchaeota archaeon]
MVNKVLKKLQTQLADKDAPANITAQKMTEAGTFEIPFGKHAGTPLNNLMLLEPGYVQWILSQQGTINPNFLKVQQLLQQLMAWQNDINIKYVAPNPAQSKLKPKKKLFAELYNANIEEEEFPQGDEEFGISYSPDPKKKIPQMVFTWVSQSNLAGSDFASKESKAEYAELMKAWSMMQNDYYIILSDTGAGLLIRAKFSKYDFLLCKGNFSELVGGFK